MGNIVSINLPCCSERKPGRPELDPEWKATLRPPVSPNARGFWNGFGETNARAKCTTWALDGLPPKEIENARSLAAEILSYAKRGQCDRIETLLDAEGLSFVETRLLLSATDLANGDTALMLATRHGHTSTAYFLIERGADLSARNRDGMTAAQLGEQEAERRRSAALPPEPPSRASWHERVAMPAKIRPTRSLSVPQGARAAMSELTTVLEDQSPRRGARDHALHGAPHRDQSESQPGSEPGSESRSEPSRAPNGSQMPFWISKERPGSASSSRSSSFSKANPSPREVVIDWKSARGDPNKPMNISVKDLAKRLSSDSDIAGEGGGPEAEADMAFLVRPSGSATPTETSESLGYAERARVAVERRKYDEIRRKNGLASGPTSSTTTSRTGSRHGSRTNSFSKSGATVVEDGESIGAAAARVAQQHAESIALAYARLVAQRDRADDEDDAHTTALAAEVHADADARVAARAAAQPPLRVGRVPPSPPPPPPPPPPPQMHLNLPGIPFLNRGVRHAESFPIPKKTSAI